MHALNKNAMIGRRKEWADLQSYFDSDRAEFVALYGRRRVGKTYLVNQFFDSRFAFYITGVIDGDKSEQIAAFAKGLRNIGYTGRVPNYQQVTMEDLFKQ